jgi:hypothetical protein
MSSKVFDIFFSPISLIVGDKIGHAISGAVLAGIGIATGQMWLVGIGLSLATSSLGPGKPKMPATNPADRLYAQLDPTTPRKWVFGGTTALATDVRYDTYTGAKQEFYWQVIACASHKVQSIDEIWLDNEKAWSAAGGVLGRYAGYLTVTTRLEGNSGNGVAIDGVWTASSTLTGCAYVVLKFKLTGNSSNAQSPFASGISSRVTIRGKGAWRYDPRLDSTVPGGSGTHRASDQSTWTWDDNGSRNPALQVLWYMLGWRINGKLALGMGLPASRIDLPSFITAANICDESVALAAGGTEPRYRCDGVLGEGDDRQAVIENLCAQMSATLRDAGGKLSLVMLNNDLAAPVASFTEADVLEGGKWAQTLPLSQSFNIVRGRRIDPSDTALYQPVDFPEVSLASPDGIDRIDTVEYQFTQSNGQAQRLAKQRLQRVQYQGRYTFTGGERWWRVSVGQVVQLSHQSYGWSNKLFRVVEQEIDPGGPCKVVLLEENAAIYAWAASEVPAVTPGAPTVYDPLNAPLLAQIRDTSGAIGDGNRVPFSSIERGVVGYGLYDQTAAAASLGVVVSGGKNYLHASGTFTANNQELSIGTAGPADATLRIPAKPGGERLYVSARVGSAMPSSGCSTELVVYSYDSSGTALDTKQVWIGFGSDPVGTYRDGFVDIPSLTGVAFYQLRFHANNYASGITGVFDLYLTEGMITSAGPLQTAAPNYTQGPNNLQLDALTSVVLDPIPDVVIRADSSGAIKSGQLPLSIGLKASAGSADYTSLVAWSRTDPSGVTSSIGASTGIETITAFSVAEAYIPVQFTYGSGASMITRTGKIHVIRKDDLPSTTGGTGGGGGGTGGSSGSTAVLGDTTGTGYDFAAAISNEILFNTGSLGKVDLAANVPFERTAVTNGQTSATGKWQIKPPGGSYADVAGSETNSIASARTTNPAGDPTNQEQGSLVASISGVSLTANTTGYKARFCWHDNAVSGTASRVTGVGCTMTATGS